MDWLVDLYNKLVEFLYRLIISLVDMLRDLFIWIVDSLLSASGDLLKYVFSFFEPVDISTYLTSIPPTVAWVFSAIGLPQALGIIMASLTVRLLLQLIPFVRLGS